jgi:hypothetical protein
LFLSLSCCLFVSLSLSVCLFVCLSLSPISPQLFISLYLFRYLRIKNFLLLRGQLNFGWKLIFK